MRTVLEAILVVAVMEGVVKAAVVVVVEGQGYNGGCSTEDKGGEGGQIRYFCVVTVNCVGGGGNSIVSIASDVIK